VFEVSELLKPEPDKAPEVDQFGLVVQLVALEEFQVSVDLPLYGMGVDAVNVTVGVAAITVKVACAELTLGLASGPMRQL
jgi:hypothetical protein